MNRVTLVGRLVADAELRYTQGGVAYSRFCLAVRRPGDAKQEADFIDVVCWRRLAEVVANYGTKGRLVGVDGRLQVRNYKDGQGIHRTAVEVGAGSVTFLDRRREVAAEDPAGTDSEADAS